jgi:hypothetical protein
VGEIVDNGRTVVSIYSDLPVPRQRVEVSEAEERFDREYADLESLAFSPFVGYKVHY